jgi:hypothetical protein
MAGGPGAALPDTAVAALAARTEGWAAGLQLAALSLRGQADAAAFVAAFTGSHRYVLDYLGEEVLECQPEQLQTFLLETSVLERLSGGLCDAVTGRAGSQALLEQVEQAGLFCCRSMMCAAGGVTTACSPICSAPACSRSRTGRRGCTGTRPPGMSSTGWPMRRSGTRSPPGR